MPRFFATSTVEESISKYLKKDEYKKCRADLCSFFKDKTIQEILSFPILLNNKSGFHYIKSRVHNGVTNRGKSSGYRFYYFVDDASQNIYIIGFYPKSGKYGRNDLTDTEEKIQIKLFSKERSENKLIEYDVSKDFSVIEIKKAASQHIK